MKKKILLALALLITSILLSGCLNKVGGPADHGVGNGTPAASAPTPSERAAAMAVTPAAPAPEETFAVINLAAKNIAFNVSTIRVPAGENVTVNFDNQDVRVPHNFAVYETDAARKAIFQGEIVSGPARIAYSFRAPEKPGTYFFRCDVHPTTMTGKLIVTPAVPVSPQKQQSATAATTSERQPGTAKTAVALPSPAAGQGQRVLVEIRGYAFSPDASYVPAGTTVVWRNLDPVRHTVTSTSTSAGARFDSGIIDPGGNFSHLFQESGTYDYLCLIHPSMKARVVVLPTGVSESVPAGVNPSEVGSAQSLNVGTMATTISTTSPEQPTKVIVDLLAKDMNFDKDKITVIAGSKVYINFVNLDTGVPHNFAVYTGSEAEDPIFQGQVVIGPARIVYAFDAPVDTGIYFFRCDVHPKVMTGDFYVVSSDNLLAPETSAAPEGGHAAEVHGAGVTGQGASPAQTNVETGNAAASVSGAGSGGAVPEGIAFDLIAENVAFDLKTMTVPAGARVTVNFNNRDSGIPHNFAVYENSSSKAAIFRGKIVTGPARITYTFDAPKRPGNYLFRCDVHPNVMTGELRVVPSAKL